MCCFEQMKFRPFLLVISLISFISYIPSPVLAIEVPPSPDDIGKKIEVIDQRGKLLDDYLAKYNSPLTGKGEDFVKAADDNGVDWRLVPAIAGAESTFGQKIPGGHHPAYTSYNGWGWGVYGDKVVSFNSWKDAIYAVTKGLKKNYIDKGLQDPETINSKYSSSPNWKNSVNYFLDDMTDFAKSHPTSSIKITEVPQPERIFLNDAYLKVEHYNFSLMYVDQ
jgi:hypothetical protein